MVPVSILTGAVGGQGAILAPALLPRSGDLSVSVKQERM